MSAEPGGRKDLGAAEITTKVQLTPDSALFGRFAFAYFILLQTSQAWGWWDTWTDTTQQYFLNIPPAHRHGDAATAVATTSNSLISRARVHVWACARQCAALLV